MDTEVSGSCDLNHVGEYRLALAQIVCILNFFWGEGLRKIAQFLIPKRLPSIHISVLAPLVPSSKPGSRGWGMESLLFL